MDAVLSPSLRLVLLKFAANMKCPILALSLDKPIAGRDTR